MYSNTMKVNDSISIFTIPKKAKSEDLTHFYHQDGLTCTQIAAKVGVSKQLVLRRLGKRQPSNNKMNGRSPDNYRHWLNPPYGTKVVGGKLKANSEEVKVIRLVMKFRDENKWSWQKITTHLNDMGISNRVGKKWSPTSIRFIHKKNN